MNMQIESKESAAHLHKQNDLNLPLLYFIVADLVLIFDHAHQSLTVCVNVISGNDPEKSYNEACQRIKETIKDLSEPTNLSPAKINQAKNIDTLEGNISKRDFEGIVAKTKEFIRSGDIIQAVLSQRFSIPYNGSSINLYRAIRAVNPSPYMFLLEDEDFSIVGASPEVHVRLTGENVLIRLIAGTHPRGKNENEDRIFEKDLLKDEKEKAEHLMLVDSSQ